MTLHSSLRWGLGLLGLSAILMAAVMAWAKPDASIVIAFLAAGIVLVVLGSVPSVPSKITIGGNSLEYPVEQLVEREYARTLQHEVSSVIVQEWQDQIEPGEEAWGAVSPPGIDEVREMARNATTRAEIDEAFDLARNSAQEQARQIKGLLDTVKSKRG